MTQEKYEKKGDQFWIIDEELGIHIEDIFEFIEKEHYPNGQLRFEIGRKGDFLHGPSFYYSANGRILSKTWYVEGKKMGKIYRYYSTGQIYCVERYVDGYAHLAQEYYYIDGTVKTIIQYRKGKFHGDTILYWPDGTCKRKTTFIEGKKQNGETFYDEEGATIGETAKSLS